MTPARGGRSLREARKRLREFADREHAAVLGRFFKTGPGEYGEGDRFLGLRVPEVRRVAGEFPSLGTGEAEALLASPLHEERFLALLVLMRFYRGEEKSRPAIYRLYLNNTNRVNNWDLVDLSSPQIVGAHLLRRSRRPLYRLARSRMLWERRIAVMATFHFIRQGECDVTLELADMLRDDPEDLIHKAAGWMLREVGKRDVGKLRAFLAAHGTTMPRRMLRYAIEKLPPAERRRRLAARPPG